MRKITTITSFIQELSFLLDKGIAYSVEEVNKHIENKDVVDWLEQDHPFGGETGLDFSMFKKAHRDYIHESLESYFGGYAGQERRKWGIENNGLCLLVSWSIEVVRDINGRVGQDLGPEEDWIN